MSRKLRYSRPALRLWALLHPRRARMMDQVITDLHPVLERLVDHPPAFTCPRCDATSYNPNDVREGYCGRCHDWTGGKGYGPHNTARSASAAKYATRQETVDGGDRPA